MLHLFVQFLEWPSHYTSDLSLPNASMCQKRKNGCEASELLRRNILFALSRSHKEVTVVWNISLSVALHRSSLSRNAIHWIPPFKQYIDRVCTESDIASWVLTGNTQKQWQLGWSIIYTHIFLHTQNVKASMRCSLPQPLVSGYRVRDSVLRDSTFWQSVTLCSRAQWRI